MRIPCDWLWTGEGAPQRGALEIDGHRIARVVKNPVRGDEKREWQTLAMPGLVNAHAHLDLSWELAAPRMEGGFSDWLLGVRDERARRGADGLLAAASLGARRALATGTSVIVDYDAAGASERALAESPIRRLILREVISFRSDAAAVLPALEAFLDRAGPPDRERRGFAPHAPYTVHEDVLRDVVALAERRRVPWSMHVAEQPFEEEFLRGGSGEIARLFSRIGIDVRSFPLPRATALVALAERALLGARPLIVHGNYLGEEEIEILARARATVVYCPRSHRWFGHAPHPLPRLLAAGIIVALGTDGMLSNGELSILEEMREVRRAFPALSAARIASLATASGHAAIAGTFGTGTITPGAPADVALFRVRRRSADVLEDLLASDARLEALYIAGAEYSPGHP